MGAVKHGGRGHGSTTTSGQTAAGRAKEAPRSSFLHSEGATNRRARPIRLTIPPFYCVACQLSVRRVRVRHLAAAPIPQVQEEFLGEVHPAGS